MKPQLILPNRRVTVPAGQRIYFLGGPIRGGGGWHEKAILYLTKKDPGCWIVCPDRYIHNNHPFAQYALPDEPGSMPEFEKQTLWERYYLEIAASQGCVIIWLAAEDTANPRKKEDGPYGRDTYGEIGEWRIRAKYGIGIKGKQGYHVNVVIGGEETFHGIRVIRRNQKAVFNDSYVIYPTLEKTLDAAFASINVRNIPYVMHITFHAQDSKLLHNAIAQMIREEMEKEMEKGRTIILEFTDITEISYHAAIGLVNKLLDRFPMERIKQSIIIRNATAEIKKHIYDALAACLIEKLIGHPDLDWASPKATT